MNTTESLKSVIGQINSGKQYPALSLVKSNPEVAALISKLVKSRDIKRFDTKNPNSFYELDQSRLAQISDGIKERISDVENMMQLFPDLELAAQILVSSILSPKDMVNTEIIYKIDDTALPTELSMKVIEIVKEECEGFYELKKMLPDMLRDVLFNTGSDVRAVIPESAVDELINGSNVIATEQLNELFNTDKKIVSLGILGGSDEKVSTETIGLEAFNFERIPYQHFNTGVGIGATQYKEAIGDEDISKFIGVTDNFKLLKLPKLIEASNHAKLKQIIGRPRLSTHVAVEALSTGEKKLSDRELEVLLYKGNKGTSKQFIAINTQKGSSRKSVGRPLVMKLPSESVIPVHVPGDKKHHIGYFVIIDEEGNPVTRMSAQTQLQDLQSQLNNQSSSMSSYLIKKANQNLVNHETKALSIDQAAKIYAGIVETDLIQRLRNGIYGSKAELGKNADVYRIMLARTFANQYTRLVYIPEELVTYFVYKYYDNGIGKSMLDDLKVLTSLRSILLFAKVMALTKNSISLTHVNMTLDPNDPDPQKTVEMGIHEVIKMRQQYFPLGINSPTDLVDWIQRAGFEFTFEGHPGLPQTKFDFSNKQMQHTVPDSDLDELLRKQTFMALGLSPETIDAGFGAEFATTVVANNILLSKRVLQIQEQITPQITDHVRKLTMNDAGICNRIIQVFKENKGLLEKYISDEDKKDMTDNENGYFESLLDKVIMGFDIDLPKPDITTLENQTQAYTHYEESIDKALNAWVSSEFITQDTSGEVANSIEMIKSVTKAYFLRSWMAENGYMTELNDIVATDEDGKPIIDLFTLMKDHIAGITRSSVGFLSALKPMSDAADKDIAALGGVDGGGGDTGSSSSSDSSDFGGGDDFGMGGMDDLGSDLGGGSEDELSKEVIPEISETTTETKSETSSEPDVIE